MSKKLDLSRSVYDLVKEYPEVADIMSDLGFSEIKNKVMLNSIGRVTTIPKGAKAKDISIQKVIMAFIKNDFEIVGEMPDVSEKSENNNTNTRTAQLKDYLRRLGEGEDIETVKADFVKNFKDVEASEIMKAEQEMIAEGTPITEVQKLCDVHSALFHGATREEKIANAERAVAESVKKETQQADYSNKLTIATQLAKIEGHPLYTFSEENKILANLIEEANQITEDSEKIFNILQKIKDLSIHYAKKGDLLYPHLKVKYEISGPSDVMWTVDDEIRDEINDLLKIENHDKKWFERVKNVIKRADEMIYKEANILFPICAVNFTENEWKQIYHDSKDYNECFGIENKLWIVAQKTAEITPSYSDKEIVMPGGHMNVEQLTALLNTIPLELTFIDADNINRFFNEGPKVFKRPAMAIDREVFSCHPPKVEGMVHMIIDDFRNNRSDTFPVWMEKSGKTFLVTYMAVRDKNKNYLGTLEVVQDMEFAKEHFKEN